MNFDNETPNTSNPPTEPVCGPLLKERTRRRESDAQIIVRLTTVDTRLTAIEKISRATLGCLVVMVISATLEYAGVIGKHDGGRAIWSRAVMDGVASIVTGVVTK